MTDTQVVVVRTGTANLASILAGLKRIGATAVVSEDREQIAEAPLLVLPGVGTLAAAMERLNSARLIMTLRKRIQAGRPTLAVCLGLQMLCVGSDESPGLSGLAVVDGRVTRYTGGLRVPQLGWNRVVPDEACGLLEEGYAYFANSYCLRQAPDGWSVAWADYGGPFVAAMEKGAVLACQFHPELSSQFGSTLIRRWLDRAMTQGGSPC